MMMLMMMMMMMTTITRTPSVEAALIAVTTPSQPPC